MSISCSPRAADCHSLRVGHFEDLISPGDTTFIIRTDTDQTEDMPSLGLRSRYHILWADDCTYMIFDKRVLRGTPFRTWDPSDTLTITVDAVNERGFSYTAVANWTDHPITGYQLIR